MVVEIFDSGPKWWTKLKAIPRATVAKNETQTKSSPIQNEGLFNSLSEFDDLTCKKKM